MVATTAGAGVGYAALALEARALGVSIDYLLTVRTGMLPEATGRVVAANAAEVSAMREAFAGAGQRIIKTEKLKDPRLVGRGAWEKMEHVVTSDGARGTVHYLRERITGIVQDFKFK